MSETIPEVPPPEPEVETTKPPEAEPKPEPQPEPDPLERRFSRLTARLSNVARERDELAQRLASIEQQQRAQYQPQAQQVDQQTAAYIQQEAQRLNAAGRMEEKSRSFHEAGGEAYPDWQDRCRNLMAMGADPQFAELLIELPNGHKVAGALADEPEELERIAAIRTERGRAIALGQYAAKLDGRPVRQQSNAPKPITPVTSRSTPRFNEYNADAQTLVQHYARQALERQATKPRGGT